MVGNGVRPIRSAGIRAGVSVGPPAVESRPLLLLDMTLRVAATALLPFMAAAVPRHHAKARPSRQPLFDLGIVNGLRDLLLEGQLSRFSPRPRVPSYSLPAWVGWRQGNDRR
jgi:hypothetical protein